MNPEGRFNLTAAALRHRELTLFFILVIAIGRQLYAEMRAPDSLAGLQQQNAALRADLARLKTELDAIIEAKSAAAPA